MEMSGVISTEIFCNLPIPDIFSFPALQFQFYSINIPFIPLRKRALTPHILMLKSFANLSHLPHDFKYFSVYFIPTFYPL